VSLPSPDETWRVYRAVRLARIVSFFAIKIGQKKLRRQRKKKEKEEDVHRTIRNSDDLDEMLSDILELDTVDLTGMK
jgi:hypothetical protein